MVDNSPSSWVIFFILDQSYSLLIFFKYEIQMVYPFNINFILYLNLHISNLRQYVVLLLFLVQPYLPSYLSVLTTIDTVVFPLKILQVPFCIPQIVSSSSKNTEYQDYFLFSLSVCIVLSSSPLLQLIITIFNYQHIPSYIKSSLLSSVDTVVFPSWMLSNLVLPKYIQYQLPCFKLLMNELSESYYI